MRNKAHDDAVKKQTKKLKKKIPQKINKNKQDKKQANNKLQFIWAQQRSFTKDQTDDRFATVFS
jgi:hypothetical protein